MKKITCKVSYRGYSNVLLPKFCTLIEGGLYANPIVFTNPPVPLDEFKNVEDNYINAVSKYNVAPKIEKTNMLAARGKMITVLDKLAVYTDDRANGDANIITLSGFEPTKATSNKSQPIDQYNMFEVERTKNLGEALLRIETYPNGKNISYYAFGTTEATLPEGFIVNGMINFSALNDGFFDLNKGRIKLFKGLTTNTTYYFYIILANAAGLSQVSTPVSIKI